MSSWLGEEGQCLEGRKESQKKMMMVLPRCIASFVGMGMLWDDVLEKVGGR